MADPSSLYFHKLSQFKAKDDLFALNSLNFAVPLDVFKAQNGRGGGGGRIKSPLCNCRLVIS